MNYPLSRRSIFVSAGGAVLGLIARLCARTLPTKVAAACEGSTAGNGMAMPNPPARSYPLGPLGRRTTFVYDSIGALRSRTNPDGRMTAYDSPSHTDINPEPEKGRREQIKPSPQVDRAMHSTRSAAVAFGPRLPDWGSWQWVGEDMRQELAEYFETSSFDARDIPESDIAFFVKFAPPLDVVAHVARR